MLQPEYRLKLCSGHVPMLLSRLTGASRYGPLLSGRQQLSMTYWRTQWWAYFCVVRLPTYTTFVIHVMMALPCSRTADAVTSATSNFTCFHSAELGADTDSPFLQPNSNYLYSVNFWQYYSAKYEYITRSTIPSKQNIQYSPNNNKNHSYKPWFTTNAKQHYINLSSALCGHDSFPVLVS